MGLTVVDAGVLIGVANDLDVHHRSARAAIAEVRAQGDTLVIPVSAYAEAAVHPHRLGPDAVSSFDRFIDAMPVRVEPATRAIGAEAATLRAEHGPRLRLPDALVIATAIAIGADRLITTDAGWPHIGVPVTVLSGIGA
jgi:predicted nucleic acid-binding protein